MRANCTYSSPYRACNNRIGFHSNGPIVVELYGNHSPGSLSLQQWLCHSHDKKIPVSNTTNWLFRCVIFVKFCWKVITEFTAHDFCILVTGWIEFTFTMHAPHPPSEHINFVPLSSALVRINVFKLVFAGTVDEFTETRSELVSRANYLCSTKIYAIELCFFHSFQYFVDKIRVKRLKDIH